MTQRIPGTPRNAPIAAISFTSPAPKARIAYRGKGTSSPKTAPKIHWLKVSSPSPRRISATDAHKTTPTNTLGMRRKRTSKKQAKPSAIRSPVSVHPNNGRTPIAQKSFRACKPRTNSRSRPSQRRPDPYSRNCRSWQRQYHSHSRLHSRQRPHSRCPLSLRPLPFDQGPHLLGQANPRSHHQRLSSMSKTAQAIEHRIHDQQQKPKGTLTLRVPRIQLRRHHAGNVREPCAIETAS